MDNRAPTQMLGNEGLATRGTASYRQRKISGPTSRLYKMAQQLDSIGETQLMSVAKNISIQWVPMYPEPDRVVWINVLKLDKSWRHEDTHCVGKHAAGPGNAQPYRYNRFGEWFSKAHPQVWMPHVALTHSGNISFSDGRHRFAWLRDHGVRVLPVTVSPEIEAEVRSRFGTKSRKSCLPLKAQVPAPGSQHGDRPPVLLLRSAHKAREKQRRHPDVQGCVPDANEHAPTLE